MTVMGRLCVNMLLFLVTWQVNFTPCIERLSLTGARNNSSIFTDVSLANTVPSLDLHSMRSATPTSLVQVRVAFCPTVNGISGELRTVTPITKKFDPKFAKIKFKSFNKKY